MDADYADRYDTYMDLWYDEKLPPGHTYSFNEDDDEYSEYCQCGKWLERGCYEHWDHIYWLMKDGTE